ncbi:MAG: hypothetical protein R3B72_24295 [Polyangiaceae bacterium]
MGSTLSPELMWTGYPEGPAIAASTVDIGDYLDCNGSRGINAIVVATTQYGSSSDEQLAASLEATMKDWGNQGLGIRWISLLLDDPGEGPPSAAGAKQWKDTWGLDSVAVCADPGASMVSGGAVGTPMLTIVDPRTMQIVSVEESFDGDFSAVIALAQSNM